MVEEVDSAGSDPATLTLAGPESEERSPKEKDRFDKGSRLGRYIVVDKVGEGGMGQVFRAYDPELEREVALKVLHRRAMLDPKAERRLVQEARAMAKLTHPNVVVVHDVESADANFLLVMEFVRGTDLSRWLGHDRAWTEVLTRFREAGRGLAAAHKVDLLHRDFKPSNVLVPESGPAKVTDFGLAKSALISSPHRTEGPACDGSTSMEGVVGPSDALTEVGTVLGTPRYMAPEQHDGEPLDHRVDQYSFCVALWEALTGEPPFAAFSVNEIVEQKREGPPPWPDGILIPRPIISALRRGLSPSPDARWPSIVALLEALDHDPARRRRRWWIGGVALAAMLGAWQAGTGAEPTQQCTGAPAQRAEFWNDSLCERVAQALLDTGAANASEVWSRAESKLEAYTQRWEASHTDACEATTIRGEQSSRAMDLRMSCLRRARQEFEAATDVLLSADAAAVQQVHRLVEGLPALDRCADVEILEAHEPPPRPEDAEGVERMRRHRAEAEALFAASRYDDARRAVDAAFEARAGVDYVALDGPLALLKATILTEQGEYESAVDVLRDVLELAARQGRWELVQGAAHRLVSIIGSEQARPQEAQRYLALAEVLAVGDPGATLAADIAVGLLRLNEGDYPQAERVLRAGLERGVTALGTDHPRIIESRISLAYSLQLQGKYTLAEQEYRTLLENYRQTLGPGHPRVALMLNNLSAIFSIQRRDDEFRAVAREALQIWESSLGPDHPDVGRTLNNLGRHLYQMRAYDEAEAVLRRGLKVWHHNFSPDHPSALQTQENLVRLLSAQGHHEQAEAMARDALARRERTRGPEHTEVSFSLHTLAHMLRAQGRFVEAEQALRRALAIQLEVLDHDAVNVAYTRIKLVEVLLEQQDPDAAAGLVQLAELAWAHYRDGDDAPDIQARSAYYLARAQWVTGSDPERAGQLTQRALEILLDDDSEDSRQLRAEIVAWRETIR